MADRYIYRIAWSEDDGEYVASCVEFPSLSWLAETDTGALLGLKDLVRDVIADMEERGEPLPVPYSMRKYSGKFQVRVPPELHRRLRIEAVESNVSLNRLVNLKLSTA